MLFYVSAWRPGMAPKMRVCFVIGSFMQGGAQRQCAWLANAMAEDTEIELLLLYFKKGDNFSQLDATRVNHIQLSSNSLYNPLNILKLIRRVRAFKPDIVFSWLHSADVLTGLARAFFSSRTKWIIAERDSLYSRNWRYELRRLIGRHADAIAANSSRGSKYWQSNGVSQRRLFAVNNILSPELLKNRAVHAKRYDVVYAGRIEQQKNVMVLCESFLRLSHLRPELKFAIIGDGSDRAALEDMISKSGVEGRVVVEPYNPDILSIFMSNPVYVSVSHHEGLPNTIVENVFYGNRVVASRIPEHLDLLGPHYPYFVDFYDDPDQVASMICQALADHPDEDQLSYARRRINEMTPRLVVSMYKDVFYRVKEANLR